MSKKRKINQESIKVLNDYYDENINNFIQHYILLKKKLEIYESFFNYTRDKFEECREECEDERFFAEVGERISFLKKIEGKISPNIEYLDDMKDEINI